MKHETIPHVYLEAIETRLSWKHWSESEEGRSQWQLPDKPDPQYASEQEAAYFFYHRLLAQNSPTYYMDRRFCEIVDHFRQDMPDDLAFDEEFLQSASGWLLLAKPFAAATTGVLRIQAIGWEKQKEPHENVILFCAYCSLKEYDSRLRGFHGGAIIPITFRAKLQDRVTEREEFYRSVAEPRLDVDLSNPDVNLRHEVRWIYTAFWLMAQRISATTRTETKQRIHRHLKRAHAIFEPVVQVVTLRRMQYENKTSQPHTVDWQYRWIVDAHGRKQYYPSTGDHKYILIDSYVKGPPDKPLKGPASKIYVARR